MNYNILEFGAKGDGITNNAEFIQRAIDVCHKQGGGQVIIPSGNVYKSGSILLKSNVDLHIEKGAILKASDQLIDFKNLKEEYTDSSNRKVPSYINCEYGGKPFQTFIYAYGEKHVSISGLGKIDGNEEIFYGSVTDYHIEGTFYPRIPLILIENSQITTIKEITLQNSGFWTVHLAGCEDVLVDSIRILNNLKMANSDGINPDHCKNVRIVNCHIECGDDCIVIKNTKDFSHYGPTENILISGCTLISTSAALKIGTESVDDFNNIIVTNCTISRTNRGISMQLRDKGNIKNVVFSNINIETRGFSPQWWGRGEPIYITTINRNAKTQSGKIKNITFNNINCLSENGIFISGCEDNMIEDILFNNVTLEIENKSKWGARGYDIRPCEGEGLLNQETSGVYCYNAKNIRFEQFKIYHSDNTKKIAKTDFELKNVDNIKID
jgi:polygalacturonase